MKCPHCKVEFHSRPASDQLSFVDHVDFIWHLTTISCPNPSCYKPILLLNNRKGPTTAGQPFIYIKDLQIYPEHSSRDPVKPDHIPPEIYGDYLESCKVLSISPKASAALSRRCFQLILSDLGYTSKDLSKQIGKYINESDPTKAPSPSLKDTIDFVRHFGNFSAHAITDLTTLQVIDVEEHEADWCLQIVEALFEHCWVAPAVAKARKDALNEKLDAAGRNLME